MRSPRPRAAPGRISQSRSTSCAAAAASTSSPGKIRSEVGRSELFGGAGDDQLTAIGGDGNILDGGRGNDRLRGSNGRGVDTFVFNLAEGGTERIFNFGRFSVNDIGLDRFAFAGIADEGAPGLLDDLDAIADFSQSTIGVITFDGGLRLIVETSGLPFVSFADIMEDPASQLILADTLV